MLMKDTVFEQTRIIYSDISIISHFALPLLFFCA